MKIKTITSSLNYNCDQVFEVVENAIKFGGVWVNDENVGFISNDAFEVVEEMNYTNKALLYAEKFGIIEYKVDKNYMYYQEFYTNEPNVYVIVNLETMEESRLELTIVKNRSLVVGQKIKVYYNLHKKCFSIQSNGLVVAHTNEVKLENCTFKVFEKGRQRVLAEKRKNVHAFVVGAFVVKHEITPNEKVYYNPYKVKGFTCEDGSILLKAKNVTCANKNIKFA